MRQNAATKQNWYNLNGVTDQTPLTKPFYAGVDNAPLYLVENSWRPDNINAEYPRLSISPGTNNAQISRLLEKKWRIPTFEKMLC